MLVIKNEKKIWVLIYSIILVIVKILEDVKRHSEKRIFPISLNIHISLADPLA